MNRLTADSVLKARLDLYKLRLARQRVRIPNFSTERARQLGVSRWTILDALTGRTWKHVKMFPDVISTANVARYEIAKPVRGERWKRLCDIDAFSDLQPFYEVSSRGRVVSTKGGKRRILKIQEPSRGQRCVGFSTEARTTKYFKYADVLHLAFPRKFKRPLRKRKKSEEERHRRASRQAWGREARKKRKAQGRKFSAYDSSKVQSNTSGVYKIVCVPTGKYYVGSSVCVKRRWRVHRRLLRMGEHHSRYLQRAWNKYGEGAFEFVLAIRADRSKLLATEQRSLDAAYSRGVQLNGSRSAVNQSFVPRKRTT